MPKARTTSPPPPVLLAQRGEGLFSGNEPAGALEQHPFVIKHYVAQLRVDVGSKVLAGFNVVQGRFVVAKLEFTKP